MVWRVGGGFAVSTSNFGHHSPFLQIWTHYTWHHRHVVYKSYVKRWRVTVYCVTRTNIQHASIHHTQACSSPHENTYLSHRVAWSPSITHTHTHTEEQRPHHGSDTLSVTLGHSHTHDSCLSEIMISLLQVSHWHICWSSASDCHHEWKDFSSLEDFKERGTNKISPFVLYLQILGIFCI